MGYAPERLRFILDKPKVNTTQRTRSDYLTPKIVEHVLHAERFLFQMLPEYLPAGIAHPRTPAPEHGAMK